MQKSVGAPAAAPTGCYKCGRPGHWSRDCPFSPTADPDSSKPASDFPKSNNGFPKFNSKSSKSAYSSAKPRDGAAGEKPKKQLPRTMPKLTPELLLSDDGLGFVLRHFPRAFKYHGRGHEVKLWILFWVLLFINQNQYMDWSFFSVWEPFDGFEQFEVSLVSMIDLDFLLQVLGMNLLW